jgi:two-component system chemotaxis response regulator CheB
VGTYPEGKVKEQVSKDRLIHFEAVQTGGESYLRLRPEVKMRTSFENGNLLHRNRAFEANFDLVFCRNVLIYFNQKEVQTILRSLGSYLRPSGLLVLGSGEAAQVEDLEWGRPAPTRLGAGILLFGNTKLNGTGAHRLQSVPLDNRRSVGASIQQLKPRILFVDDEPDFLEVLSKYCENMGYEHSTYSDPVQLLREYRPLSHQVLFTDYHMPGLSGDALAKQLQEQDPELRCVMITGYKATLSLGDLMQKGFVDVISKPLSIESFENAVHLALSKYQFHSGTIIKKEATDVTGLAGQPSLIPAPPDVLLIGASTGGPQALAQFLSQLPLSCPPILIVQHISADFAAGLAKQLTSASGLALGRMNEPLQRGTIYISCEAKHLHLIRHAGATMATTSGTVPVHGQCPAVEVLFDSALSAGKQHIWAGIFTGMGRDGGEGLLRLRRNGSVTFSKSEASCVVYGMPGYAESIGASQFKGSPTQLRDFLLNALKTRPLDVTQDALPSKRKAN